jgi:hypothetical protein
MDLPAFEDEEPDSLSDPVVEVKTASTEVPQKTEERRTTNRRKTK